MAISGGTLTGGVAGGTGALTIQIYGLDENYDEQNETVNLNGTTSVNTVNSYTMIYRMIVRTAGSGGQNAGDITATAATDGTVTAQITATYNQTTMAIYQVPRKKSLFIRSYYLSTNDATGSTNILLYVKPFGEAWQLKHIIGTKASGNSAFTHVFSPNFKIEEKSLVKISANTTVDNKDVSAGFDSVLHSDQ